jgi:predicted dinucleotide-binding enzyme|tara:strand:- start:9 stop:410 length:402 start_codon:yes stop_codon:yes gene_type:complete
VTTGRKELETDQLLSSESALSYRSRAFTIPPKRFNVTPVRWVAAWKTTSWKTFPELKNAAGIRHDCFMGSSDAEARNIIAEHAESFGFRAVDSGDEKHARTLDFMVPLMIELDRTLGGDNFSFWKFLDGGRTE